MFQMKLNYSNERKSKFQILKLNNCVQWNSTLNNSFGIEDKLNHSIQRKYKFQMQKLNNSIWIKNKFHSFRISEAKKKNWSHIIMYQKHIFILSFGVKQNFLTLLIPLLSMMSLSRKGYLTSYPVAMTTISISFSFVPSRNTTPFSENSWMSP